MIPRSIRTFLIVVAIGSTTTGRAGTASTDDDALVEIRQVLARRVTEVFSATCIKCHGPNVKRPKGRFGYLLDLSRVAANPDLVVPFDPDNSQLFMLVRKNEMPPPDSDFGPISDADKRVIRLWIEAGPPDPCETTIAGPGDQPTEATLSTTWRLVRWLGRFHPASVHLPIGLLLAAALAELLVILTGRPACEQAGRFCIAVAALTAAGTAALGWAHAVYPVYADSSSNLLLIHRWLGTTAAAWALVTLLLSELRSRRGAARWQRRFRMALFLGAVVISVTSFFGGSMVWGLDHYRW